MSDLKEKCLCFYVLPETLEKWMETILNSNIDSGNCFPPSGKVLQL